ncbi:hypothetical protein BC939DRAFT_503740 [Gamsiella multidivaricata]|uniref:uncharacterized protein n=1 Tax=Gamsiella multidivaricata TaxID=101098 RepID=UPI00221E83ED|nr:uncharacterized protein BC939DRAFT_503740 [Gamsiella multidivaricata]KAG0366796.1 hypothetical protein BGZ54_004873 [Gamsiella multidivaricata]KAI7822510.1 hypothetical protein BC939DRAFT_503740 [Gamsiella multidivaricata]
MENGRNPSSPPSYRPSTPPSPSPQPLSSHFSTPTSASTAYNIHQSDEHLSASWRRNHKQNPSQESNKFQEQDGFSPFNPLLPTSYKDKQHSSGNAENPSTRTVVSIRILAIVILISLFSWFYLEALAGGDIEWVKDHLSMLGVNLVLSVLCLTTALTMIVLTPMSTTFAVSLFSGIAVILFALKKWDDGESFETHGAYNMLVFLVILVPLNGLIQSILFCRRKMSPPKFRRFMTMNIMGTTVVTTLMLMYYHSIWGIGANGAHLIHGTRAGAQLCEWDGLNIPAVDLLPNYIQNFWTGQLSCPVITGIDAEWSHDGILTINCLNKEFKASGQQPTYDVLPDTKSWPAPDKIMHTYNKKIVERTQRRDYTEPVLVNDDGVESLVAHCEAGVSKILIRVVRDEAVLERVRTVEKVRQEQEETTTVEQEMADVLNDETDGHGQRTRKPNVMVLFMDAVARRQFYRKLPKTAAVVASLDKTTQGGPQLHEFFRYHAVGFNTDANSRVVYTNASDRLDPAALPIWKNFHEGGYITSRVEDNCEDWSTQYTGIATSQYFDHELQSPFCLPPYYALDKNPFSNFEGPYSIVARCLHGNNVHKYALDYMNQFRRAYPDQPWFQMGSFIEGHEGTGEVLLTLDNDFAKFMKGMEEDGTLENTIIFMMADHGLHMGINFMFTPNGRIEHMNPYLSVILPPLVTKKYPSLSRGLMHNQQSLVTGYEIHATLKMLASGAMPEAGDDDDVDGGAWRSGTLFDEELNPGRTCEQAKVPEEYCKCRAA